jgi:hypothetical protein
VIRCTVAVALAALALLAAGCGKDEDPAQAWADGVCSSLTTWSDSVNASVDSLTAGNLSQDSLNAAVDDVTSATNTLASDLKDLGAPETDSGEKAQKEVTDLTEQLTAAQNTISKAFEGANGVSETLAAASVATATLSSLVTQVTSTFDELEQSGSDSSDELRTAFKSSDECKPVREQLNRLQGQ